MSNDSDKKKCGLCHENVAPSEHNKNGTCNCIGCPGGHCQMCPTYQELILEIQNSKWRCRPCRGEHVR